MRAGNERLTILSEAEQSAFICYVTSGNVTNSLMIIWWMLFVTISNILMMKQKKKLYPRFTDINAQLKHLYCSRDLAECNDYLIQPAGKLKRNLIEEDWSNLQRVIATLALKEMKQSTLIKKLCTYTQANLYVKRCLSMTS